MAKKLTYKQKLFAKKYVENGGNGVQTALQVYNVSTYASADAVAREVLENPRVQQSIDEQANSIGITPTVILQRFDRISAIEPEKTTPEAILRATENLGKILNMYPATKHARLNVNMKADLKDLNFTEVKKELEVIDQELKETLEEE